MKIPTREECLSILKKNGTPDNVIAHTTAVADFALTVVDTVVASGREVNRALVEAGALLHDVEKLQPEHEQAGAALLRSLGYPEVATVVSKHGLKNVLDKDLHPSTIEEKIVFYADKRVKNTTVVSLNERLEDIKRRHGELKHLDDEWAVARDIEKDING